MKLTPTVLLQIPTLDAILKSERVKLNDCIKKKKRFVQGVMTLISLIGVAGEGKQSKLQKNVFCHEVQAADFKAKFKLESTCFELA